MSRFPRPGRTPRPRPVPTAGPTPSPTPGPGTTFTLTTRSDTATANLFNGPTEIVGNFAINTLNNGDQLTGVGVNPTLDVQLNVQGGVSITPAQLNNIQTLKASFINLGSGAAGSTNLNIGNGTDSFTSVELNSPLSQVSVTGIGQALANIAISNVDLSGNQQSFVFDDAALVGPANAVTVSLNNVNTRTVGSDNTIALNTATAGAAVSNYETVNIVSNGQGNNASISQNSSGLRNLNVSGAANFTTRNLSTNLTSFNASAATGATVFTETQSVNASYIGGSGASFFDLGTTYNTSDTVNGGVGGINVLSLAPSTINATANQANVSNFNVLQLGSAATSSLTVTPAFYGGANTLALGADVSGNTLTVNFAASGGTVDFRNQDVSGSSGNGNFVSSVPGTATNDVLNLAAANTALNVVQGTTTATNFEVVNVVSNGTAAFGFGSTFTVAPNIGGVGTVNVTGSAGTTFAGAVNGVSLLNASTAGGSLKLSATGAGNSINITGTNFNDTLVGSSANDIISGTAGTDVIDGNAGIDALIGGTGFDTFFFDVSRAASASLAANNYTVVGDFTVGTLSTNTDILTLDASSVAGVGLGLSDTSGNLILATVNDPTVLTLAQNTTVDISGSATQNFQFIKITTPTATAADATAQQGYAAAIGAGAVGVGTAAASSRIAASYYDTTNSQAVIGVITNGGSLAINSSDTFTVVTRLAISQADYATFGSQNLDYVIGNGVLG